MSWIPQDWDTSRASGYGEFHYLIHTPCGYQTSNSYDLVLDLDFCGRKDARDVVFHHECEEY